MKFEGYHKIPSNSDEVSISIPLSFFEKYEIYKDIYKNNSTDFIKIYNKKNKINSSYDFNKYNRIPQNSIITDKSLNIIGKDSINTYIKYITEYIFSWENYSFYEELYRICVKQLLLNGWPMDCMIYQLKDYPYTNTRLEKDGTSYPINQPCELFILGPHIPMFDGHTRLASLFAYLVKNGKISKLMNEFGLEYFYESPLILIENEDAIYLELKPYEKVLVWFFIGDIGF